MAQQSAPSLIIADQIPNSKLWTAIEVVQGKHSWRSHLSPAAENEDRTSGEFSFLEQEKSTLAFRMNIAGSELMTKIAALRHDGTEADVTLTCESKTILAHSFILNLRFVFH